MTDVSDSELLAQFARHASEPAFAALVERHLALVHSVARRHTADPQQAQDIAQTVFIILARKAGTLGRNTILPGWLYHTARLTAANWQRAEFRRRRREQETFMQSTSTEPESDAIWRELSPHLEAAVAMLGADDRDALVLRYFQNQSMAGVAAALGLTENTAQKRVDRALEKLRKIFMKRGLTLTAALIAGAISANSVQAAPAGLAQTISSIAVAKGAAASGSTLTLIKGALKIMAWTKTKTAIVVGASLLLATGTTTLVIQHQGSAGVRLRNKVKYTSEQASVQDVVQNLAKQAGLRYNWRKSFDQTDPICRQWVRNLDIEGKTCAQALEQVLKPVGLRYQVERGMVVLSRQPGGAAPAAGGADQANPPLERKVKYTSEQASVQEIVQNLAQQAGLKYDWKKSFAQTDPVCRQWVRNVSIEDTTCAEALDQILKPVSLRYQVADGVLVLSR